MEDQLFDKSPNINETVEVSPNEMTNIQFQLCATSMTLNYVSELNDKLIPGDYEIALIQHDGEDDVVKSEIQKNSESEVDQVCDKMPQRDDTNVSDKQCDDSVGDVPLEIEDEYVNVVNSSNLVDMMFYESLQKDEESLPKQTTLNEGQEVTFKHSITGISEQRMHSNPRIVAIPNGFNLYSNETDLDVNNLSLLVEVHGNYTLLELSQSLHALCVNVSHDSSTFVKKSLMVLYSKFRMVEDVYRPFRNLGMSNTPSIVCTQHYRESLFFDISSNHVLIFFGDILCFWSEGFGIIFGWIKAGRTSHVDSLRREGQLNFPASHSK